ncbi:YdcF family protein [Flavobacterium reichenbachii]|uniref:YdcF family protein n=1 Tax=Flavobacterium reichenbachii TaxID=362418 RepID=UPI000B73ADFA|nr:YdcF family protein [Flavobacterium reichenbachii]OXB10001.1 hypothetical protein B0A68_22845 [Flavobacterium reichenbachii]
MKKKKLLRILLILLVLFFAWTIINAIRIYDYSKEYYENTSDVGIVLGAGAKNAALSPVFKERVNHSIKLFKKGAIKNVIFTGGFSEKEKISDSKAAAIYAQKNGVPIEHIFIEEKSTITYTNLKYAKEIMDKKGFTSALIISDPIHMKRSILLSEGNGISCYPSPTKTSMYKSTTSKLKFLLYESFYYNINLILGHYN